MKHKFYKNVITAITFSFLGTVLAQKVEKKFTENFKVNKDVEVAINATNTEINVTTWNKNEVQIDAHIQIDGISKEKAEKYIKNWNFEALGNKNKVQITSKGSNTQKFEGDFIFFGDKNFNFPDITIPDIDIELPDVDFNFETLFKTFDVLEENIIKNGNYSFEFDDGKDQVKIKSKEEWEQFKKSKKYEVIKNKMLKNAEKMVINGEKLKINLSKTNKKIDKEKLEKALEKANIEFKKIDKEKLKEELAKVSEELKKMKFSFSSEGDNMFIDGKKVKIKKRLEIKVPKEATFNLNTRHCKVKLPNIVAFGNVKHGTFDAHNLNGGKLTIDYSPVTINDLNACTLFLNNVTDAKIASVTNTNLNTNSSGIIINLVNDKVDIKGRFGDLEILNFSPSFSSFNLNLDASSAILNFKNLKDKLNFQATYLSVNPSSNKLKNTTFHGMISAKNNRIIIEGKNSKLTVIK